MKILVLTNTYPPYITGGYEIACFDNIQRLRNRGHDVYILTSDYRTSENNPLDNDPKVFRKLLLEREFYQYHPKWFTNTPEIRRQWTRIKNASIYKSILNKIKPDLIFYWNMGAISFNLMTLSEKYGKTVYYLSDMWMAYTPPEVIYPGKIRHMMPKGSPLWKRFYYKSPLFQEHPPYPKHVILCSKALQQEYIRNGFPFENSEIIYHGIDPELFYPNPKPRQNTPVCKLLFVGRLIPEKGIETLIDAMDTVVNKQNIKNISLSVLGTGTQDYQSLLQKKVQQYQLKECIQFNTPVSRDKLRDQYWSHDILVFPSIWLEPFALIPLEAMASGIPLVSTTTGGSGEILKNNGNSLTFQEGNPIDLSDKLIQLIQNPSLRNQLKENAFLTMKEYTLDRMAEKIGNYLLKVLKSGKP